MPAATSNPSVSPARRIEHHRQSLPFVQPGQNPFTNPKPLQSPQSHANSYRHSTTWSTPVSDGHRSRGSIGYIPSASIGPGMGMMPTPDPTVGSCMSEEDKDVAIQLMRLGEMSNISHGRTSASTMDEALSGRAEVASSAGATSDGESDSEEDMPAPRRQRLDAIGNHRKILPTTESHFGPQESVEASGDDADFEDGYEEGAEGTMAAPKLKHPKPKTTNTLQGPSKPRAPSSIKSKTPSKPGKPKAKKLASTSGPMSPASLPASRKQSVVSNSALSSGAPGGEDDQPDLSTKPRCQRCRKSKKGCDRQRPCGRCRDAGIPAEQCISEDEGNGRKGRYGRHMGVPVGKDDILAPAPATTMMPMAMTTTATLPPALLPPAPIATAAAMALMNPLDKNKKRKR
jgi:hypothetical protein